MSSLNRVFEIIEVVVSRQNTGMTFAEVVAHTGMPKASVHRILKELTHMGFLTHSESKRYKGSLKLAALGSGVMVNFDLRDLVHPQLLKLHQETQHTCHMGIKHGKVGIYVDKIESQDFGIKLFSAIGKSFPLHSTGLGKVLLANADAKEREQIMNPSLESYTDRTITDPKKLKRELKTVLKQGYAVDCEEITRGLMCVAAPVFGVDGEMVCAISATFPSYLERERGIEPEIDAIMRHAKAVSGVIK